MSEIILLLVAGIGLICLEVFVPGGILGILGALAIIAACVLSYDLWQLEGALAVGFGSAIVTGLLLFIEFKLLGRTYLGSRLFLKTTIDGDCEQEDLSALVGQSAKTVTRLSPTGLVEVGGQRHEAFSRDGQLPNDLPVRIVAAERFRLIVERVKESN